MTASKRRSSLQGQNEANITPLADVTTTLIVVFLITMPAMMWNGIQVNSAEAGSEKAVVTPTKAADDGLLTVTVTPAGITLNGEAMDIADPGDGAHRPPGRPRRQDRGDRPGRRRDPGLRGRGAGRRQGERRREPGHAERDRGMT